jgi:hypothetical protein
VRNGENITLNCLKKFCLGEIKVVPVDEDPEKLIGLFSIELNTRIYTLRANNDAEAAHWVSVLNKIKNDSNSSTVPMTRMDSTKTNSSDGSNKASSAPQFFDISNSSVDKPERTSDWLKSSRSWYRCGCCS